VGGPREEGMVLCVVLRVRRGLIRGPRGIGGVVHVVLVGGVFLMSGPGGVFFSLETFIYSVPWSEFAVVPSYPHICSAMVGVFHRPILPSLPTRATQAVEIMEKVGTLMCFSGPFVAHAVLPQDSISSF